MIRLFLEISSRMPICLAILMLSTAYAQVRPIYDSGAAGLSRQLQRLQTTASVMHTGAHPDDEDSALLAYLARGEHARTAYLALTRGDGGQNLIGAELFESLGVIRTEELLQARMLDGAEQLFTRLIDYGFSEHRAEAARLWDEELVLGDMVRAIRLFRPMVIVSRFTGTAADGHGHHQYVGYLTPLAFAAAANPNRFPEHFTEGLTTWQVQKLYVSEESGTIQNDGPVLQLDTGKYDPVIGRSYYEIGMEGRSQQKTQQMGSLELRGAQVSRARLIESLLPSRGAETSVFDGIDTSLIGIAAFESHASTALRQLLVKLERVTARALASYDPHAPQKLLVVLAEGNQIARRAAGLASNADARRLLDEKVAEFETALRMAAGISIDALSDAETVVPGDSMRLAIRVFAPDGADVKVKSAHVIVPDNWTVSKSTAAGPSDGHGQGLKEHASYERTFDIAVPGDAQSTQPYWLERPRKEYAYDWSTAGDARNQPFRPPLMMAEVDLMIGGETMLVKKEVEYRYLDGIRGEIRRPVNVVPAISVAPASRLLVLPGSELEQTSAVVLTVTNNARGSLEGTAALDLPPDWTSQPTASRFALPGTKSSTTLHFQVTVPAAASYGGYDITAVVSSGGSDYRQTMQEIVYPHIQTHRVYHPATLKVQLLDVDVAPVRVAYVMGSGDSVPEAIRQLGLDVVLLDDDDLRVGNLAEFDTIVVGIRASTTRAAFVANNARLLDFARQGGTVIVQYQQPDYVELGLAPYPARMDTSVRVVDESAPVTVLEPEHPVFNFPNKIKSTDFDHWVQERNGYTFTEFDRRHYIPLLESHDDGEPDSIGGMMYAQIGRGKYVYTSYAWFRQLPQGVPGAYRIFANLLSLPKAK